MHRRRVCTRLVHSSHQQLLYFRFAKRRDVGGDIFNTWTYYNDKAFRCLSTNSAGKRRRRRKSLSPTTTLPKTTRQRLRQMVELNQTTKRPDDRQSIPKLISVATERLAWLQTTIYKHWNPDYVPDNPTFAVANKKTGETAVLPRRRPFIVMDTRWWFWQIMFALFPAAVIAVYCEFRVKPYRAAVYARQEQRQLQAADGEHNSSVQLHTHKQQPHHSDKSQAIQLGSIVRESIEKERDASLGQRFNTFWTELQSLVVNGVPGTKDLENSDKTPTEKEEVLDTTGKYAAKTNLAENIVAGQQNHNASSVTVPPSIPEEPVTLQGLMRRIEQLEHRLGQKNVPTIQQQQTATNTTSPDVGGDENSRQSGTRSRIQDRIRESALAERGALSNSAEKGKSSELEKDWSQIVWKSVKAFMFEPPPKEATVEPQAEGKKSVAAADNDDKGGKETDSVVASKDDLVPEIKKRSPETLSTESPKNSAETATRSTVAEAKVETDSNAENTKNGPWWKFW